jgi:hypothetical protein
MTPTPYGLRVVGHRAGTRRLVNHAAAFRAYAECDPRADLDRESYLTAFRFPFALREHFERERTEKGYGGPCGSDWLWWDIDRPDDLPAALRDARRLCGAILDRYRELDDDDLLIFLSGGKGVHVGLPAVWRPDPSPTFNAVAKLFCLDLAEAAGVAADGSVYTKTRLFRAPNSRHPKTGLHKRRLTLDELTHLTPEAIVERARRPEPFDIPTGPALCLKAADDWSKARRAVERRAERQAERSEGPTKLQALTMDFIRDGANEGEREMRTFRAAANLAEFGCPDDLAFALLTDVALDSGLTPSEARRAIVCGLAHARRQAEGGTA